MADNDKSKKKRRRSSIMIVDKTGAQEEIFKKSGKDVKAEEEGKQNGAVMDKKEDALEKGEDKKDSQIIKEGEMSPEMKEEGEKSVHDENKGEQKEEGLEDENIMEKDEHKVEEDEQKVEEDEHKIEGEHKIEDENKIEDRQDQNKMKDEKDQKIDEHKIVDKNEMKEDKNEPAKQDERQDENSGLNSLLKQEEDKKIANEHEEESFHTADSGEEKHKAVVFDETKNTEVVITKDTHKSIPPEEEERNIFRYTTVAPFENNRPTPAEGSELWNLQENDKVAFEGSGHKKRFFFHCCWTNRYFVLTRDGDLNYYSDVNKKAKLFVKTADIEVVSRELREGDRHPHQIFLGVGNYYKILAFDSAHVQIAWASKLSDTIHRTRETQ